MAVLLCLLLSSTLCAARTWRGGDVAREQGRRSRRRRSTRGHKKLHYWPSSICLFVCLSVRPSVCCLSLSLSLSPPPPAVVRSFCRLPDPQSPVDVVDLPPVPPSSVLRPPAQPKVPSFCLSLSLSLLPPSPSSAPLPPLAMPESQPTQPQPQPLPLQQPPPSSSSSTHRRLTKKPPSSYNNASLNEQRFRSLRAPAAPQPSPVGTTTTITAGTSTASSSQLPLPSSSTSSLDRPPPSSRTPPIDSLYTGGSPQFNNYAFTAPAANHSPIAPQVTAPFSVTDKSTPQLIGAPFDAQAIYKSVQQQQQQQPLASQTKTRPPPLKHSHTADARLITPRLRQSASFAALGTNMDTITPPRSDGGTKSPRQRYSDESGDSQKNRKSDGGKKKGGFSSFMNSLVGSPRRPTISTPTNPMHVTHVSIDNETGLYTVCCRASLLASFHVVFLSKFLKKKICSSKLPSLVFHVVVIVIFYLFHFFF